MSVEVLVDENGILAIEVSGKLSYEKFREMQSTMAQSIKRDGRIRVLTIADGFDGWEKEGDWGNLTVQAQLDPFIDRMAIVGEKKWEDLVALFTAKGLRQFPIEFFPLDEIQRANAWIRENA